MPKRRAKQQKPPMFTPKHGHGRLFRGGVPGNKGGGRPPNEFRERIQEVGWAVIEDLEARINAARLELPPADVLEGMEKEELLALLEQYRGHTTLTTSDLRQLLDFVGKYTIGQIHRHGGDDGTPIRVALYPGGKGAD